MADKDYIAEFRERFPSYNPLIGLYEELNLADDPKIRIKLHEDLMTRLIPAPRADDAKKEEPIVVNLVGHRG